MAGGHAGHAVEQHAHAAMGLFQIDGARLHRHAPGHFAHGCEQGQAAPGAADGFIGDAHRPRFEQGLGLHRVWRQVQVAKEDLSGAQQGAFGGLGLLDLDHHVGARIHLSAIGGQSRADSQVLVVAQAYAIAHAFLHQHRVAPGGEFAHARRRQADPVFMVFYLCGKANKHAQSQGSGGDLQSALRRPKTCDLDQSRAATPGIF